MQSATSKNNFSGRCVKSQHLTVSGPSRLDKAAILACQKDFVRENLDGPSGGDSTGVLFDSGKCIEQLVMTCDSNNRMTISNIDFVFKS